MSHSEICIGQFHYLLFRESSFILYVRSEVIYHYNQKRKQKHLWVIYMKKCTVSWSLVKSATDSDFEMIVLVEDLLFI